MSYLDYFCELLKRKFLATGKITDSEIYRFQTKEITKNLYHEMSTKTKNEYKNSNGDELKKGRINKMRSSAAMIYNLLGNEDVLISKNGYLPAGKYEKEFEYKLPTLKTSSRKANLDAWLHNNDCEIFIESKCLEWLENKHKKDLTDSYFRSQKYFYPIEAKNFVDAGRQINLSQYDSCQMFKHTLAIYNYLKDTGTQNKRIYLINVVWEPDENELPDEIRAIYKLQLELEHREFNLFYEKMKRIITAIKTETRNNFDIIYLSVSDFNSILSHSDENQRKMIKRYL